MGTSFVGLTQDADSVTVELSKTTDGQEVTEKAKFAYVVGSDGAHSMCNNQSSFWTCFPDTRPRSYPKGPVNWFRRRDSPERSAVHHRCSPGAVGG